MEVEVETVVEETVVSEDVLVVEVALEGDDAAALLELS